MNRPLSTAAVVLAATLASCGGGSTPTTRHAPPPPKTVQGHPCSPRDEALQCVLPPSPAGLRLQASPFVLKGIDAAWNAPSAAEARSIYGAAFLAGYLSHDRSKNWTQHRVLEYREAHIGVVKVFESSAGRAGEGGPGERCTHGRTDAFYAAREAAELYDTTRPINMAIDFEASGPQVAPYFRCARQVLGGRTMAYGSYYVVMWLHAHGLVGNQNWCTYAWSNGHVCPASVGPLQQYQNDGRVDFDRAIAADYGQWPGPAPTPHPAGRAVKAKALHHEYELLGQRRAFLAAHNCRSRPLRARPARFGHACRVVKTRGDRAKRIRLQLRKELGIR